MLQPLDFFVWAIVGRSGTIVVDTGFDEAMGRKRQRELIKPVAEGLEAIGVDPTAVETVIVSHLHYDHVGNYDLFPRARYHLQDREMAYATGRCMCHAALRLPFEADDVVAMVRKVFAGRVAFHDGDDEIAPGVTRPPHRRPFEGPAERAGEDAARPRGAGVRRHASLRPSRQRARLPAHLQRRAKWSKATRRSRSLRPRRDHVVPGHDPLVLERYPAAKPGLEGWVARLDVEPKRSE